MDDTIIEDPIGEREAGETLTEHQPLLLDRLARWIVLATFFILPLFAIPSASVPFEFSKTALFMMATALAAGLWAIARLKDGAISFPRTPIFPVLLALVVVGVISTLFSGAVSLSWSGVFFDAGSSAFFITLAVFFFLFASLIRTSEHVFSACLLFFCAAALLALFHLIRFVGGPGIFSFQFFTDPTSTLLARWDDLGVFFGAVAVFTLSTLEFMKLRAGLRVLCTAALLVSLIILAAVNVTLVWTLLGVIALVFLVYLIAFRHVSRAGFEDVHPSAVGQATVPAETVAVAAATSRQITPRKVPLVSLSVFLCSIIFVVGAGPLGDAISSRLKTMSLEARPSFGATMSIARQTLTADPFLGAGPNLFVRQWLKFKPLGTNQTIFWNTDFASGVGFLPTVLVTTGILGALLWAVFLLLYFWLGFRFILSVSTDKVARYLVGAPFLTSFFLWCVLFFYAPGPTILVCTFALTALSLAALYSAGALTERTVSFARSPARSFAAVLALILFLLGDAAFAYGIGTRFMSSVSYVRGIRAANERGDMVGAEQFITQALSLSPMDVYARTLVDISLAHMNTLLAGGTAANAEKTRADFQVLLGQAVGHGKDAVALDDGSYENWLSLGRVYEAVVPLKISGAYESARAAYEEAQKRNPTSPAILLSLARLEATKGDNARAQEFITQSLQAKPNYTEAIFFLSQLEVQEGKIQDAIQSVDAATVLAPNDPVLRFQLGLLKYNEKDWSGAVDAFAHAVALNPNYANAHYFLGLSYDQLGRTTDAIAEFTQLVKTNPDNKEVALILQNLQAGRAPFANATPPVDAKPEKRSKLPVSEKRSGE